jgi:hypothetical protein
LKGSHSFQKPTGSHKKRDNRCHIAADILQQGLTISIFSHVRIYLHAIFAEFSRALGEHGFEVNTQLDDPHHISQIPLEDFAGTEAECQKELVERLKLAHEGELDSHGHKRVLILKNSHIGGHRYAGNAIVGLPLSLHKKKLTTHYNRSIHHKVAVFGTDVCHHGKSTQLLQIRFWEDRS